MNTNIENQKENTGAVSPEERSAVAGIMENLKGWEVVRQAIASASNFRERKSLLMEYKKQLGAGYEEKLTLEMRVIDAEVVNNNQMLFEMRNKGEEGTARYLEIVRANKKNEEKLQQLREEINQSVSGETLSLLREGDTLETLVSALSEARATLRNLKEKAKTPMIPSEGDILNKEIKGAEEEVVALEEALTEIKTKEGLTQKAA